MTKDNALKIVFARRKWYVDVNVSMQLAYFYKKQYASGKLSSKTAEKILNSHGFNKTEEWV